MKAMLIGVLWLALASPAAATDLIAVDAADAPFMYDGGGHAAGLYPLLIAEAYRRIGDEVSIVAMPWKRALDGADGGENGVGGLYKTESRLEKYDYSDPLFDETLRLYVRKGHDFPFAAVGDLKGRTIGVIRGWSYGDGFDAARKGGLFSVEEASGDEQSFAILDAGHIDGVLAIREAAAGVISAHRLEDRVEALPTVFSSNPSYLAFAKSAGASAKLARLDAALAAMRADGSFDRLVGVALRP